MDKVMKTKTRKSGQLENQVVNDCFNITACNEYAVAGTDYLVEFAFEEYLGQIGAAEIIELHKSKLNKKAIANAILSSNLLKKELKATANWLAGSLIGMIKDRSDAIIDGKTDHLSLKDKLKKTLTKKQVKEIKQLYNMGCSL